MVSRRELLISGLTAAAGAPLIVRKLLGDELALAESVAADVSPAQSADSRVVTPNGSSLPWKIIDGVKCFHLIAGPVRREFAPGLIVECWGYNGTTPGPTIEAVEGERCRFYVTNKLPEPTTVHWHGVRLPNGMDGVSGLTQPVIKPGETFLYEFIFRNAGTFMYHPHFDEMVQIGLGMMGMIVVQPKSQAKEAPDKEFAILLSEWAIKPGTQRPDPSIMNEFNVFTLNSRVYPGTDPLVVKTGQRVRIHLGNLSAIDHHSMHMHGFSFQVVATDGGAVPESARWPETTTIVPVGSVRVIDFIADTPGDWPFHCHMTHHFMNQMGHGLPNVLGIDARGLDKEVSQVLPGYMTMGEKGMGESMKMGAPKNSIPMVGGHGLYGNIDMGGMFTVIMVRDELPEQGSPGWYKSPESEMAKLISSDKIPKI